MRQQTLRYIFTILAIFATLGWNTQECKAQECDLQETYSNHSLRLAGCWRGERFVVETLGG